MLKLGKASFVGPAWSALEVGVVVMVFFFTGETFCCATLEERSSTAGDGWASGRRFVRSLSSSVLLSRMFDVLLLSSSYACFSSSS